MKFKIFGLKIEIGRQGQELYEQGVAAKKEQAWEKIRAAIEEIEAKQIKYSEYRLQKISGVSINTIKKYRGKIEEYRQQIGGGLF